MNATELTRVTRRWVDGSGVPCKRTLSLRADGSIWELLAIGRLSHGWRHAGSIRDPYRGEAAFIARRREEGYI